MSGTVIRGPQEESLTADDRAVNLWVGRGHCG